jgi:hypothetical protein
LATSESVASTIASVGALRARDLHRAHDERMRAPGGQPDHQRAGVDPAEPGQRLLRRRRRDLGADVEQHQQVAEVGGEERHLVGARDQHAVAGRDQLDRRLDLGARDAPRGVLDVHVVGGDRRLERVHVEREQRSGLLESPRRLAVAVAVLLARGLLQLGEALEPERLREPHDGRR